MLVSQGRTPKTFSSQITTAMTTTAFMIDLMRGSIGIYVLISHNTTPTTIRIPISWMRGILAELCKPCAPTHNRRLTGSRHRSLGTSVAENRMKGERMGISQTAKLMIIGGVLASVVGCKKNEVERPSAEPEHPTETVQMTGTGATASGPAASAQQSIAEARCAREQTCANVGENNKYSSHQDCLARVRADWKDDLNARECPRGVNQAQLNECLAAIRAEDCGNPFDTLGRLAACTTAQICQD